MSITWGAKTTAEAAASALASHIKGRTVIVTGASPGGLGAETARVVAQHQPRLLVIAGRSLSKLEEVSSSIKKESPDATLKSLVLDLASTKQIRAAAKEVLGYPGPVDVLINNAAVMACPYSTTSDGFEMQFGTNHLGHFLFTNLIMPKLLASPSPRIVNVSSIGHYASDIRYDDPGFDGGKAYSKWPAYGQAKTANVLFSVALAERYKSQGLTAFSLNPGGIQTPLQRHFGESDIQHMKDKYDAYNDDGTAKMETGIWKTVSQGTSTHIRAAFDPSIADQSGSYLNDCAVANDQAKPYALDKENAEKLWTLSEKLLGDSFPVSRL